MREKIKYNIFGLAVAVVLTLAGCQQFQEVEPVISPDGYPVATFTTNLSGTTVTEGDTILITITLDKMLDRSLTYTAIMHDGTIDDADYLAAPAVIDPYTLSTTMMIIVADIKNGEPDPAGVPEMDETVSWEIGLENMADKYLVNPSTENLMLDLTVKNVNDSSSLTIAYGWANHDDDIDIFSIYDDVNGWFVDYDYDGDGKVVWDAAASSDNPEVMFNYPDDPPGTYHICIDPYIVNGPTVDYTFSIGYPDQTVEIINGVVTMADYATYPMESMDAWGIMVAKLLNVTVEDDGSFTVVHLNE